MSIRTYDEAAKTLGNKDIRSLPDKETHLARRADGRIAVTLHGTDVVTYHQDSDTITLGSGGYVTLTTARRMNTYTPESVHVRRSNGDFLISDATASKQHWDGLGEFAVQPA